MKTSMLGGAGMWLAASSFPAAAGSAKRLTAGNMHEHLRERYPAVPVHHIAQKCMFATIHA